MTMYLVLSLLSMLLVRIHSCLRSILRHELLILDTYHPDTLCLCEEGGEACDGPWLFFKGKGVCDQKSLGNNGLTCSKLNNSLVLHTNTTICLRYSPALACFVAFSMLSIRDFTERRLSWREMPALCCRRTAAISFCTEVSRELLESAVITGNCVGMFGPAVAMVGCFCDATTTDRM